MTLKEIEASEQIMRMAINGQNHVDSLIGYYRDLIDTFNDERAQWAIYYQICKENVSNRHLIEREINCYRQKQTDTEADLATVKAELTYERQKYFQKIERNEMIKQNLKQNKQRLHQLNEICGTGHHQVSKDYPQSSKPNALENSNIAKSQYSVKTKAPLHETGSPQTVNHQQKQKQSQKPPLKNCKLNPSSSQTQWHEPSEEKARLELQLINMHRDHCEKKQKLQEVIEDLKDELSSLVEEHSERGSECSREYEAALNKLIGLENKHMNLVMEFFRYRMDNFDEEKRIQEENEIIRLKNTALVQKLRVLQDKHSTEFKNIDSEVKKRNKEFKQKYDQQLKKKEEHLSVLKEQHERISDIYLNKLKKLEAELRETTQKANTIEEKTKVEVSSLKSQIKILTNRLENVAMNHMRSELVNNAEESEEDSSATLEAEELDRINNEVKDLEKRIEQGTRS